MKPVRLLAAACLLALSLAIPAQAEELDGSADARSVIQSQLDAFSAESAEEAYEYAAPNIRRMFPTARVFGLMVRRGYPMVWSPADTEFLDARKLGDSIIQRLRVIDRQGRAHIAEYMMVRVEGEWRIAGVSITRDDSFGV